MKEEEVLEKSEPVKKKLLCPRCHRKLNTNCFVFNKILKTDICHQCNKSVGNNKFYNPNREKSKGFIGKFNISSQEKKILMTNLIKKGVPYQEAKRRVKNNIKVLSEMRKKKDYNKYLDKQNELIKKEKSKEMKSNLLKGLGIKEKC